MNEIVKYENQFNAVALRKFNAVDLDFLMMLCYKFKEKGDMTITMSFSEVRSLANYKQTANSDLVTDLQRMNEKLLGCHFKFVSPEEIVQFVLFTAFRINPTTETLTAKVNDEFAFLLNELDRNFTRFELNEFLELKSSYAKECYRRLKQFRTKGWWEVSIDEFRRLLDVAPSYKMCDVDKNVLRPIEKELALAFNNFKIIKKYKKGRGRGGKVVSALRFEFDPETVEKPSNTECHKKEKNGSKPKPEPRKTDFMCPECGQQLYEMTLNGNNCWCHDFKVQGDSCKQIYNSVAEVKGYDEEPQNQTYNTSLDDVDQEYNKQKIQELLDSLAIRKEVDHE